MHSTDCDRVRGRELQRIRKELFERDPLCAHCKTRGRVKLATEVDHILALANGGADVGSNRQGLCARCHKAKTIADFGHAGRIEPHESWSNHGQDR